VRGVLPAAVALAALAPFVMYACDGEVGNPAAPAPVYTPTVEASTAVDAAEAAPPRPLVTLGARVQDLTTSAPIPNVIVVVEVGGLNQPNPAGIGPDGGPVATLTWNPYYQYAALTDDAGAISLQVPGGSVGLHAFAADYLEGLGGPWDAGPEAGSIPLRFFADAGALLGPVVHGLTPTPLVLAPGQPITFTVEVDNPGMGRLSSEVILVEPTSHQAWGLAAPSAVLPGNPSPPGIYTRIVPAPSIPGVYRYDVVAASFGSSVSSNRATALVTVTADGGPPGKSDASAFPDTGGLPDGRH